MNVRHGAMRCVAGCSLLLSLLVPLRAQTPTQAPVPEAGGVAGPPTYVLQRGDELEIKVLHMPELSQVCAVRPDGRISLLQVSDVNAAGMTATELASSLSREYGKYYREPQVSVIVRSFSKMNVYVGGEVAQPGSVPMAGEMTAAAAVIKAGGLRENARGTNVTVLRNREKGAPEVIKVNVDDVLANGVPDTRLEPSDLVFVPKSNISVYVGGEVLRPGLVPLVGEMTALAAISQAGGLRETAKANNLILVRNNGNNAPQVTKFQLTDVLKGKPDTKLQPFDVVFVPKSTIAKVDQFVDQYVRKVLPIQISGGFSYLFGGQIF